MRRRRTRATAASLAGLLVAAAVAGCGQDTADALDYTVDGGLGSYNVNTVNGAASGGAAAFARTLTGFGLHGPDGQVVPDSDFGTVSVVGQAPLVLDYRIADDAVWSDGAPVTCDDMVLSWVAQAGRVPGFDAASRAGYTEIGALDCAPGAKAARVTFAPERTIDDWPQLFDATSMLPSHVLDDVLGLDVTAALQTGDPAAAPRIAQAWNTLWTLGPDVDLARFPSSGPYRIDAVADDGAVTLVANDRWWGTAPVTPRITVRPLGTDLAERLAAGDTDVVDIAAGAVADLAVPEGAVRADAASAGVEQVIFAPVGPLAPAVARRAVALCTPRDVLARDAGVPVTDSRLNTVTDDAYADAERAAAATPYLAADPDAARAVLDGTPLTVRIGYHGPDARSAAAVAAMTRACAPAGITVVDAGGPDVGPQTLREGRVDALVASIGGATGSGSSGSSAFDAWYLHSGNGNNLPGFADGRVDAAVAGLAIATDAKVRARLLADGAAVLWAEMPTLPLHRQQRTLITSATMDAVDATPTRWGAGWNMDRWVKSR